MLLNPNDEAIKLDPRVKRTRHHLLQAFEVLLAEKDFVSITVQDIAERAEVNRATFYAHFEDKFALLDYSVREQLRRAVSKHLPEAAQFTLSNFRILTVTINDFVIQFVGHCHPTANNELQMRVGAQIQQYTYELLLSWMLKPSPMQREHANEVSTIAAGISWMIFGPAFQAVMMRTKPSAEQLADQIIEFLTPSLSGYLSESVFRQDPAHNQ